MDGKVPQLKAQRANWSSQLKMSCRLHDFKRKLSVTFVLHDANAINQGPLIQQVCITQAGLQKAVQPGLTSRAEPGFAAACTARRGSLPDLITLRHGH